ncbi:pirin family protein [Halobacteriovorax sp. ZH4_bin.1]|uniref:pirin family protein n=1 Tax=unclassified Halobacteriovorax TaxID=2639665 RepID=UPI00371C4700
MTNVLHRADSRGYAEHGWLKSNHTFSFANYYDPERIHFGTLRVINDDVVAPGEGFSTHPHRNMEIISIPLKGSLHHQDTIGNDFIIRKGEIQVMSAGSGISHSEYNNSDREEVHFLQIWVLPKEHNIRPSYSQKYFKESGRRGEFQLIVSPDGRDNSVTINQNAFFSLANLEEGQNLTYKKFLKSNGVYLFVIDGEVRINDLTLSKRDGLGIDPDNNIGLKSLNDSEVLVMEVPMDVEKYN